MNIRFLAATLLAALQLAAIVGARAQAFNSVSSQPAAAPPAAVSSVSSLPAPVVSRVPATGATTAAADPQPLPPEAVPPPAATLAFSSVSSMSSASGSGPVLPGPELGSLMADRIVVEKGARRLYLFHRGRVIAEYPVRLGLSPKGHKQYEGDFRTPEGVYYLSRRNPNSEYYLSVEVSYPNEADRARAKAEGVRPGGLIMIHGQPNVPKRSPEYYANTDWTDGCIAVSNAHMAEIWRRTRVGIPIEIRP